MLALTWFRLAGYARSHRALQPLIGLFPLLAILYASPVPAGAELGAAADSAAILVPVFAWAARGLLDTEPDEQRAIALTAAGSRAGEVTGGLLGACLYDLVLAVIAVIALVARLSAPATGVVLTAAALLHLLAIITGVTLGALTSRPILPSPAVSTLVLIFGYLAMLLIGASGVRWIGVPLMAWMNDAHHGVLLDHLPLLAVQSLLWPAAGLAAYAVLRRTRP